MATKPKDTMISRMGLPFEILKTLVERVYRAGGDDESVRRLLSDAALLNQVAQIIAGAGPTLHWFNSACSLDYWLKQTYSAGGNELPMFLLKDKRICAELFPDDVIEDGREKHVSIVKIRTSSETRENALYWLNTQGYLPASFSKLVRCAGDWSFRHRMPRVPIVAIKDTWAEPRRGKNVGDSFVPYVHYDGDVCFLGLVSEFRIPKEWLTVVCRPNHDYMHFHDRLIVDAMPDRRM